MHRKLTDEQILSAAREWVARDASGSGRALRRELRRRFGHVGRTERTFALWRTALAEVPTETPPATARSASGEQGDLSAQLLAAEQRAQEAETARALAEARAERAEAREIEHQDRWANEIYELRERVRALAEEAAQRAALEKRVLELTLERQRLLARLGRE